MRRRNTLNVNCGALAAAALLLLTPHATAQVAPTAVAPPQVPLCTACHGANGNSQIPLTPSLAGQPKVFVENQLVLIREGLRDIPQMKGMLDTLKDPELVALATYFSAQTPAKPSGSINREVFDRGQALAGKMLCGTCHLPDYSGRQQMPRLAGQNEAFLAYSMKQFRDHAGLGRDTVMSASLFGLKDNDLADLAHFLANFK